MVKFLNNLKLIAFSLILGAVTGVIVWVFFKLVGLATDLVWERLPDVIGFQGYSIVVCALGGLIIGIVRHFFGDYPEELQVVLGKVKKEGHYNYSNMLVMLISAFLPLVFAASVGPEAGLTGIIVGLCYWVGDNIKYAKEHEKAYSKIGAAVTLGALFHQPLFGIFAVEEGDDAPEDRSEYILSKPTKLLLYGAAIAGSLLVNRLLSDFFGKALQGSDSFTDVSIAAWDYVAMILYVVIGVLMAIVFSYGERLFEKIADKIPSIVRETICGLILGLVITFVPIVAFSGEEQIGEMINTYGNYVPIALIGIAVVKMLLTSFCIKFGIKGGHFFPLIFACICMGFGLAIFIFGDDLSHLTVAAGVVTASCLGAQMRKPIAVALLCLLCFPFKMIFILFLAAAIGTFIMKSIFKNRVH